MIAGLEDVALGFGRLVGGVAALGVEAQRVALDESRRLGVAQRGTRVVEAGHVIPADETLLPLSKAAAAPALVVVLADGGAARAAHQRDEIDGAAHVQVAAVPRHAVVLAAAAVAAALGRHQVRTAVLARHRQTLATFCNTNSWFCCRK
jgi:hypothetical protein